MRLEDLLAELPERTVVPEGTTDVDVTGIAFDSRRVGGGELFVCLEGLASDGHDFAAAAVGRGVRALVVRRVLDVTPPVPQVVVRDTREAMARLAAAFHGHPSRELAVIGVTGTNGKTTVTHLVAGLGEGLGIPVGILGTLGSRIGGERGAVGLTTGEAPDVQRTLREAVDAGMRWVAMEVSSHALAQHRVFGLNFKIAIFTNLGRDHLDYHGTFEAYRDAKARLFFPETRGADGPVTAILGADDPMIRDLALRVPEPKTTFGFASDAAYRAEHLRWEAGGARYTLVTPRGRAEVRFPLPGRYNVLNALAAQAAVVELGESPDRVAEATASVTAPAGRMQPVPGSGPVRVWVDFAHTPDALEQALGAVRDVVRGRLFVVFGCGGDRDPGKRPLMGRVASTAADVAVLTSDNPRSEDPEKILDAVEAGAQGPARVHRDADRAAAIAWAVAEANPGDGVLVAGKGHETHQILGSTRVPFDDVAVARDALARKGRVGP